MEIDDRVIIGGGVHGVCAARALTDQGASVRIFEPSGQLLDRWMRRSEAVAMIWMRSPASQHLDVPPVALHHFMHRPENADIHRLTGPFRRPLYEAFNRHSQHIIAEHKLDELVVPARVESLRTDGKHLLVQGGEHEHRARRVLVATGSNIHRIPEWAGRLQQEGAPIHHVFDPGVEPNHDFIGGGISSIQRALMIWRTTKRPIRLWLRHPVRVSEFDFDRLWTKHRFMGRWSKMDEAERFAFLDRHPQRGSIPFKLSERLARAQRVGQIEIEYGEPRVVWDADNAQLLIHGQDRTVESTGITLATGFEAEPVPGWLRPIAEASNLPTTRGFPRLDDQMHWGRNIHVSGPLTRLRLGPMASTIVGARWAASFLPGARVQPV